MSFTLVNIVGTLAAVASTVSFAPQAWRVIRTRAVEGLSAGMYTLTVAAFTLWSAYGLLQSDYALIIPNLLCLSLSLFILAMIVASARTRDRVAETIETAIEPVVELKPGQ